MNNKKLGFWTSTSLVVGNMIGSGIFLLPSTLASFGSISLLGWIISGFGAAAFAFVFIEFSKMLPGISGGPYVYARKGLGDFAGFLVAWGYWISIWCVNVAIAIALVSYLGVFVPALQADNLLALIVGLAIVWGVVYINTRGIRQAGLVSLLTSCLKIAPLLAIGILGLFYAKWEHCTAFNISGISSLKAITQTATLTFFAYMGIECATIPSNDIENPESTIPRATYFGLGVVAFVYILGTFSLMGIIPPEELQYSQAPFADAAEVIWGTWAKNLVALGAIIATFGALNGWILVQGQIPAAIARDDLFPTVFAKENSKGVPALSIVISSVLISVLMIMKYSKGLVAAFQFALLLSSMTALIAYLFTSVSYVLITAKVQGMKVGFRLRTVLATIAFIFSIWAIAGSGFEVVYWGFILLLMGIPIYVWMKLRTKARH